MKLRLATRNQNEDLNYTEWDVKAEDWWQILRTRKEMIRDTRDGNWHYTDARNSHYKQKRYIHWIKRLLFGLGIWG